MSGEPKNGNAAEEASDLELPNRIRELRKRAGLSSDELGKRIGSTGGMIRKLEAGERRFRVSHMNAIAQAIGCDPEELNAEIEPIEEDDVAAIHDDPLADAHEIDQRRAYRVTGRSVELAGLIPGTNMLVWTAPEDIVARKTGDVVVVQIGKRLVLRIFVAPKLLVTNRSWRNTAILEDHPTLRPQIVGLRVRARDK